MRNFKTTKAEAAAIKAAWTLIRDKLNDVDGFSFVKFTLAEHRGYGSTTDRIPLLAAKGLMLSWFLDGWREPDSPLRDHYLNRAAGIYAFGAGAALRHENENGSLSRLWVLEPRNAQVLAAGETAYDEAWRRFAEEA